MGHVDGPGRTHPRSAEVPLPGAEHASWGYFTWSPDGRFWTVGKQLIAAEAPNAVLGLKLAGDGEPLWSRNAARIAQSAGYDGWGETKIYRVDPASGPVLERSLGPAFPCGWDSGGRLYLIRWPGADQRFVPGEG